MTQLLGITSFNGTGPVSVLIGFPATWAKVTVGGAYAFGTPYYHESDGTIVGTTQRTLAKVNNFTSEPINSKCVVLLDQQRNPIIEATCTGFSGNLMNFNVITYNTQGYYYPIILWAGN